MYVSISPQKLGGSYSKSAADYAQYLEKENQDRSNIDKEFFFDSNSDKISEREVINSIDANTAKLKSNEPRYYAITLNPSQRELRHIQNNPEKLKAYTRDLIKDYARCFNREIFGRSPKASDILYYGKIEQNRSFKARDREVRENNPFIKELAALRHKEVKIRLGELTGNVKQVQNEIRATEKAAPHKIDGKLIQEGTPKPGPQMHVHLIVSRKDKTNSVSLSPGSKYIASKVQFQGKEVKRGFDRDRFFNLAEKRFDKKFNFQRNFAEHYASRKTLRQSPKTYYSSLLKLPTSERKLAMQILGKSGVPIPDAKLNLALKQVRKAISIGIKSSSIGY